MLRRVAAFLLGLVALAVVLEVGLRLSALLGGVLREHRFRESLEQSAVLNVLCLGDSMTARGYPAWLARDLNRRSRRRKFAVRDGGVFGADSSYILEHIDDTLSKHHPDIVLLMIGVPFAIPPSAPAPPPWWRNIRLGVLLETLHESLRSRRRAAPVRTDAPTRATLQHHLSPREAEEEERQARAAVKAAGDTDSYLRLARALHARGKDATGILILGVRKHPDDFRILYATGQHFNRRGDFARAIPFLRRAVALVPNRALPRLALIRALFSLGRPAEAKKILAGHWLSPTASSDRLLRAHGIIQLSQGDTHAAQECFALADEVFMRRLPPRIRHNCIRIAQRIHAKGIRLFWMQYPMRSIQPLQEMLSGFPGITYIDNEALFMEAVSRDGYNTYFMDQYGGDFGHLTAEGVKLLGEHAAEEILRATDP